jgi:threonine/homoserine/homoserine lactone efflux protein
MNEVVGAILPLALGITISPIPVVAAILMLLSPRAKGTSVGFLGGWVTGIVVAVTAFTLLAAVLPDADSSHSAPAKGVVQLILGALLFMVAAKQWRGRPREGQQADPPKWMGAIDSMNAAKGAGLGFLLSAVNPKNLIMSAGAGVAIGSAELSGARSAVAIGLFTLIAAASVAVPVVAYLVAADRLTRPLEALHGWLLKENATIMAVLLVVIGVSLVGKGIGSF